MDTSLIIALIGVVSTIAGFFFGRRKRHAETIGYELSHMQKAIQVWKEVADYQSSEIATLRKEIDDLKKELHNVEKMYSEQNKGKSKSIDKIKSEIEASLLEKLAPIITQPIENVVHSNKAVQQETKTAISEAVMELTNIVTSLKEDNTKQFHKFEKKLMKIELQITKNQTQ
jgi:predicted  nucleic acid-binding Zn-ribbon protein